MMGFYQQACSRIPAKIELAEASVSPRCLSSRTNVPCNTKRRAVGETWSGRTSPSGSAPWGSPPGNLGGFLFKPRAPLERLRTVQDVRRIFALR
jgi:hypothetical protein